MKQSKTFSSGFSVEETIEFLRQQLAIVETNQRNVEETHRITIREVQQETMRVQTENDELRRQLAASQAREQQLRGQILRMIDRWWPFVHKELFASDTARGLYREASDSIQPPHDTTALEAMIAKAGEV